MDNFPPDFHHPSIMQGSRSRWILIGIWMVTVLLAFATGQWMDAPFSGDRPDPVSGSKPVSSTSRDPEIILERVEGNSFAERTGTGEISGESRGGYLGAVSTGSARPSDWDAALKEAGLISSEEARAWFDEVLGLPPGQRRDRLLTELLAQIGKGDPEGALEMVSMIGGLQAQEVARLGVLEEWAMRDPTASLAWIEENAEERPGRWGREWTRSWVEGYAKVDPQGAFAFAAGLPENGGRDIRQKSRLIEQVTDEQIQGGNVGEALALLETLPEGPVRNEAYEEFYEEWAEENPEAAAQHFLSNPIEGSEGWASNLVRSWAEADPEAAAAFVADLGPENPGFERSVSSLIERWTRYDLQAPADWLNQMPPSEEIDRAVAVYSMRASSEDPQNAMTWAESIASEGTRERTMMRVAASWREADEEGFNQYLSENEFDEEFKERLQSARGGGWGRWGRGD